MQAGMPREFWGFLICAVAVGLAIGITIQVFFLLTLYRTQSQVAERNGRSGRGPSGGRCCSISFRWSGTSGSFTWSPGCPARSAASSRTAGGERKARASGGRRG